MNQIRNLRASERTRYADLTPRLAGVKDDLCCQRVVNQLNSTVNIGMCTEEFCTSTYDEHVYNTYCTRTVIYSRVCSDTYLRT